VFSQNGYPIKIKNSAFLGTETKEKFTESNQGKLILAIYNMNNTIEKEKGTITSYILGISGVYRHVHEFRRKNTFASFHIRQGWELHLLSFR
jgi:hypothetical protein